MQKQNLLDGKTRIIEKAMVAGKNILDSLRNRAEYWLAARKHNVIKILLFTVSLLITALPVCMVDAATRLLSHQQASGASGMVEVFAQLDDSGCIYTVAFSPNGRYALSGNYNGSIKLWEIATGREIRTLRRHAGLVNTVAFSPDGKRALSGSINNSAIGGNTLKLWDLESGREIRNFEGAPPGVTAVTFSADGEYALSAGLDGLLRMWDLASGDEIRTFRGHKAEVWALALSPSGLYVVSGSKDKTLKVWDVETGRDLRTFMGKAGEVYSVAFSPDGRYIVSGNENGTLKLWEVVSGRLVRTFDSHSKLVNSVAFSPDGRYLVSGAIEEMPKLWDVTTGQELEGVEGNSWYWAVAFSADGQYVLGANCNGNLSLWEFGNRRNVRSFGGHSANVGPAIFSPDGRYVLSGRLKLWDIKHGGQIKGFEIEEPAHSLDFSPDGKLAISAHYKQLKLWDIETGREIISLYGNTSHVNSVSFSPNGDYALSGGQDHSVRLWDLKTGSEIGSLEGHKDQIQSVAFSPNGHYAISASYGELKLWDMMDYKEVRTMKAGYWAAKVAYSPEGKYVLVGGADILKMIDVKSGREVKNFMVPKMVRIESVSVSPDGRWAISGNSDGTLRLWNISSGKQAGTFEGHLGDVTSVAFSPDGSFALSSGADGTIRLWDANSGKEIVQLVSFSDGEWVSITPEGYFNASPNGAKHLNVRKGMNVYSIDNFYEKFYNPALVAKALRGERIDGGEDIRDGFDLPPEVKIVSPKSGESFRQEEIQVVVEAKDTGGGIDEIRLYQNGSAIGEEQRAIKRTGNETILRKEYSLLLVPGENVFRAVGFSRDRTESNPDEIVVQLVGADKVADLYLAVVGINQYQNAALNLNFAEPDARSIKSFFQQRGQGLFRSVQLTEIYNQQATKQTILATLNAIPAKPQDVIIVYLAGHGTTIQDEWYFVPHDVIYPERDEAVIAGGLSSRDLAGIIRNIPALKKLVLVDACKSGGLVLSMNRGLEDRRALAQLARATGTHIIASSTQDQFASEVTQLGHGAFTYTLLQGLTGKAGNQDEKVTVRELITYVEESLPKITAQYRKESQYAVIDSRGQDFPIIITSYEPPSKGINPNTATLKIETQPSGATIFINGKRIGTSPVTATDIEPGVITVRAEIEGYKAQERRYWITSGKETTATFGFD